jgi:ApeA N-terminal domain 1
VPFEFKSRGYFFRPENPDKVLFGELDAGEEGISVALDGTFLEGEEFLKLDTRYPVIYGVLQSGRPVSIFGVHHVSSGGVGYPREGWWSGLGVLGHHFPEGPTFDEVHFRLDHLADWVSRTGITYEVKPEPAITWRVTNQPPEEMTASMGDEGEIAIGFGSQFETQLHRVEGTELVYAIGRAVTAMPVRELIDRYLVPIRDLITMATLTANVVEEVNVRTPDVRVEVGSQQRKPDLPLLHHLLQPDPSVRDADRLMPNEILFGLGDWTGSFEELVVSWLAIREELAPALNLVLGLAYAPPRWSDTVVLTWAQAFEAYHRIRFQGGTSEIEAKATYDRVMASCPPGDREWLRVRLEHSDEPSLRRRIRDVTDRARPVVDPLLEKRPNFSGRLGEVRNTYSHFGAVPEEGKGRELADLSETAHWVFMANVLLDLGFAEATARELLARNKNFAHLLEGPVTQLMN